ncbi:formimidoylglutamate deiminase [Thalassobaculum sp.]|uniref:formimidoylglutamate deiminase n=1 Tax=Thalassobaculum sp. TaxID=2022740 RepID=UPI0032ED1CBA
MQNPRSSRWFAPWALLPSGWCRDVLMEGDAAGNLVRVVPDTDPGDATRLNGVVIPGVPNVHSHAFQFALAGKAERAGPSRADSFWTWRELMYGFLSDLDPDGIEAIATRLYRAMLARGYTSVGEFHYVHHDVDGRPYADPAETSRRLLRAAETAGIGITLLPVYYEDGGFGGAPAGPRQSRFLHNPDGFGRLLQALAPDFGSRPDRRLGIAPHSLRAVRPDRLTEVLAALNDLDPNAPIHLHIAEQPREVADCLDWCGKRPVELLFDTTAVDSRWCLVHATHLSDEERRAIATCGAVAGLCLTTEANLGDGLFPAESYLAEGGSIGIGSDSHVCVDPAEELRWLENGQRLITGRRTVLADEPGSSVGTGLLQRVCRGGAAALGREIGAIAAGFRADFVVLSDEFESTAEAPATLVDRWIFAPAGIRVVDTVVGGRSRLVN